MSRYKLVPKYLKMMETSASMAGDSHPIAELESEEDLSEFNENFEIETEPREFKNPIEAIRWCNEKFKEFGDIKYKQIANYLHIYR